MTTTRNSTDLRAERRPSSYAAAAAFGPLQDFVVWLATGIVSAWRGVLAWRERQETRRQLELLDDHVLRDIGILRSDIEYVVTSPNVLRTRRALDTARAPANDSTPRNAA